MYIGRTEMSTRVDELSLLFKILLFEPTVCPRVILKSARSTAVSLSAKHNDTSKRDLPCHAKISFTATKPLSFLSCSHTEVAVGPLSLGASPPITSWFHKSERGFHPRVSGGYRL